MSRITPKPINPSADLLKVRTERNNFGAIKSVILVFLAFLQFAFFIASYLYFMQYMKWFWTISFILSAFTCLYVLSSEKNSQSKPIWIIFIITCFSFGYIIYFASDDRIFWHRHRRHYNKILENSYSYLPEQPNLSTQNAIIQSDCCYLKNAGNFVSYTGNKSTYFSNGAEMLDSIIENIKLAKQFIFIEFFIISDGIILNRILKLLEDKVKEGVDVRIIFDDLGSLGSLNRKTKKRIKNMGIKLAPFNKVLSRVSVFLNYRDHRKIIVLDGKVAYTGGVNLADEYANECRIYGYWKDSGIMIEGPAVDSLTLTFLRQWDFVNKKQHSDYSDFLNHFTVFNNKSLIVPYSDGLEYSTNIGKNAYINIIAGATKKIYIMSPYLVLDDAIKTLLINKAKSRVDVRIIIPSIADKKIVYTITRNSAEKLMLEGIKCFTMNNSFVHSKIILTENAAIVGSINLDLRSFYQQFENAVYLTDESVMHSIENDFENTFSRSTEITIKNMNRRFLTFRIMAGITNLLSPFM